MRELERTHSACAICPVFVTSTPQSVTFFPETLYGEFLVKAWPRGAYRFSQVSVFLVRLAAVFLVPTYAIEEPARAGAVKDGASAPP
jgi:hypothetical protein